MEKNKQTKKITKTLKLKKTNKHQTTDSSHIEAQSEYRGRMDKPHLIPAINARKTKWATSSQLFHICYISRE